MSGPQKVKSASPAPPGVHPNGRMQFRTARIHRAGNSYGFYVPKSMAVELGLDVSCECRIYIVGDVLCLQPTRNESFLPHVIGVRGKEGK